ncbi:MAG: hypothetical protein MSA24_08505 [Selenomonadaceae bacterium]|nr:hypothetical protein [Selenomonadaceae bacterium]
MKINKQELLDTVNKLMEKIGQDEAFARALAEKQTSAEVAEFLLANGISISKDTIDDVIDMLKKEASGSAKVELSEDALDNVAAGMVALGAHSFGRAVIDMLKKEAASSAKVGLSEMAVRPPSLARFVNWGGMY